MILPALIVIGVARLNDLKRLDDRTLVATLVTTGVVAGAWLGASLGLAGGLRVMLRSISVGIIEAAGYIIINGEVSRTYAFQIAFSLVYINFLVFWVSFQLVSSVADVLLISEKQWITGKPWRELIHKVTRLSLGTEELKGASLGVAAAVRAIQFLGPPLLGALVAWLVFGISPSALFRKQFAP